MQSGDDNAYLPSSIGSSTETNEDPPEIEESTISPPQVMKAKIIERNVDDDLPNCHQQKPSSISHRPTFPIPKTGFPSPSIKPFLYKHTPSSVPSPKTNKPDDEHLAPSWKSSSFPSIPNSEEEKEIIAREAERKVAAMSNQEILEAQKALKERFGESTLTSFLQKRKQQKNAIEPSFLSTRGSQASSSSSSSSSSTINQVPSSTNLRGFGSSAQSQSLLNAFSPLQLANQLPYSIASYYFDVHGMLTTKKNEDQDNENESISHSDVALTLPEILTLTHSRSIPQRVLATSLLGYLLHHLKEDEFPSAVRKTLIHAFHDLHVFIHLRTLLDDTSPNVVFAALRSFCQLTSSSLFANAFVYQPVHLVLKPLAACHISVGTKDQEERDDPPTISDHAQWIRLDLVQGLLETQLVQRLAYLFTQTFSSFLLSTSSHDIAQTTVKHGTDEQRGFRRSILKFLYFLCSHSQLACTQFLSNTPNLLTMLMVASIRHDPHQEGDLDETDSLVLILLLLRCWLQADPSIYATLVLPFLQHQSALRHFVASEDTSVLIALISLFLVISSYGLFPMLEWIPTVFQHLNVIPPSLHFSFVSSVLQHQIHLPPSMSMEPSLSMAQTYLATQLSSPWNVFQLPLDMKAVLGITYALRCVNDISVSILNPTLNALCNTLLHYFEETKSETAGTDPVSFSTFGLKPRTSSTDEIHSQLTATLTPPSQAWSMSTLLPTPGALSTLLPCLQVVLERFPTVDLDTAYFLNQVHLFFKHTPNMDWLRSFSSVFTTYLLHHVDSFTSPLHSLMAYYALTYLPVPMEATWQRLVDHVRTRDPVFQHVMETRNEDPCCLHVVRTCLFVEAKSPYILGEQWWMSLLSTSDRLKWMHQVHQWHIPYVSRTTLWFQVSHLIPLYLQVPEGLDMSLSPLLVELTHAALAGGYEDTSEHRLQWEALVEALITSSYLDDVLQQVVCYFLFHQRTASSFKEYALQHLLHTVSPLLLARMKVRITELPLLYVTPLGSTLSANWLTLCRTMMNIVSPGSLMYWCCAIQLHASQPDQFDGSLRVLDFEKKLKCLFQRISHSRDNHELIELESSTCDCGSDGHLEEKIRGMCLRNGT